MKNPICPTCRSTAHLKDIGDMQGDSFCYLDGTPLIDQTIHSCGRLINPATDKFCSRCGFDLAKEAQDARERNDSRYQADLERQAGNFDRNE